MCEPIWNTSLMPNFVAFLINCRDVSNKLASSNPATRWSVGPKPFF
jgi:hypothetical protein